MSVRWRVICVSLLVVVLGWLAAANFVSVERREAAWWWPDGAMRLGLDLRGGIHMVISPDLGVAIAQEIKAQRDSLERRLQDKKVGVQRLVTKADAVELELANPAEAASAEDLIEEYDEILDSESVAPGSYRLTLTSRWQGEVRDRAMLQTLEVLRRRVDDPATGIPESVVTRQGEDRVLVQIPGVSRVPDIFKQTGFLEFAIVQDSDQTEELLRARYPDGLPEGSRLLPERERETGRVVRVYLLPEQPDITGDHLSDARVSFDSQRNEWQVEFTWNPEGGDIFGELTGKHIRDLLAIILDEQVYSAPTIQARISRQGVITGRFSSQEAADLAVILRAGALPIPVVLEEERTIGPALGADSIRRGVRASIVGLVLVICFSVFYYRLSGAYASLSLLVNLTLLVGLMSLFEGTLTLPGIAGLVLTVGMAVDANVIIFERIREELRAGRAVRAAIQTGFEKARWTILDANITTFITAIILFEYGTGPIKGFAVTLSVGILTSVFTALVVTRLLFMIHPGQQHVDSLSI